MKEYIEREAAIAYLKEHKKKGVECRVMLVADEDAIIKFLKSKCPTVDAVEVVRCKGCQYAKQYERNDGKTGYYCQHPNCTFLYGTNWERLFEPIREAEDYCSCGVAKIDGKDEVK